MRLFRFSGAILAATCMSATQAEAQSFDDLINLVVGELSDEIIGSLNDSDEDQEITARGPICLGTQFEDHSVPCESRVPSRASTWTRCVPLEPEIVEVSYEEYLELSRRGLAMDPGRQCCSCSGTATIPNEFPKQLFKN